VAVFTLTSVSVTANDTKIYFDEDGTNNQIQFIAGDYIRAQDYTGRGVASFTGLVNNVHHSEALGMASISVTTASTAWAGMELVQVGHASTASRQNMIYITAADTNNPYIDMLSGVTDGDFSGHTKLRIGNLTGITDATFGALSGYGLYSENSYLTGSLYLPTAGITNECSASGSIRMYAGDTYTNRASAPFRVTQGGAVTATSGSIGGWTLSSTSLASTVGGNNMELNASTGDVTGNKFYMYGHLGHYNYSQQSTPYSPTAANLPNYVCLDNNSESTFNLPSSGLPGSGSTTWIIINHKYGTGLGANKYHIQGNGYNIVTGGSQVTSIDLAEGHAVMLVWEPRGGGYWTVVGN
jgi:hypothetical protein